MVQAFPVDDPFSNTAFASQPTHVQEYVGVEPIDAGWQPGFLHDGYQLVPALNPAAFTGADGGGTPATDPRGVLWRRTPAATSKVDAVFQIAQIAGIHPGGPLTGATSYLAHLRFGVFARFNAGTLTDAGLTTVRYVTCTGYELAVTVSGTSLLVSLWRYKAGSAAVEMVRKTYTGLASQFNLLLPFGLSLDLINVGGNPTLTAVLGPFTLSGSTFPAYNPFRADGFPLVTSSGVTVSGAGVVTDAHADKITTVGHAGFACARDRTLAGTGVSDLCTMFRVTESGVTLVEDRFARPFKTGKAQLTDSFSVVGRSLAMAYAFDGFADGSSYVRDLDREATIQRAAYTPAASPSTQDRFFLSQRAADSIWNQHRRVQALFDTAGSAPDVQRAGVCARATHQLTAGTVQGYVAYAQITHSGVVKRVRLSRFYASGETVLAEVAGTFPLGTAFTVALDCYLHPSATTLDGPVVMEVYVDGVKAVLVGTGVTGVAVSGAGTVTDSSASRITSGPCEGPYARWSSTLGNIRTTYLDAWTQLTLQSLPATQEEQESIEIEGEGDADGSLNDVMRQDFSVVESYMDEVLRDPFESGHARQACAVTDARRRWSFQKAGMTQAEYDDLAEFWDEHDGHEVPFNYTPPGSLSSVKAAIDRSTISERKATRSTYDVAFEVVELLT